MSLPSGDGAGERPTSRPPRRPPVLKKYGQHFLSDERILAEIVNALGPTSSDTVIEIGPGRGSLTAILAERCRRLVAIEIDRALADQLVLKYRDRSGVEIVQGDVLDSDLQALAGADFLLIGNVPYNITTPIVFKALNPPIPRRSVFLVQREVAERMAAKEDTESYGALSVNLAVVANTEMVMSVARTAFKPPPKVDSTVVRITPRETPLVRLESLAGFRTFVQAAFSLRRKQMQKVLRTIRAISPEQAVSILERAGIEATARPEVVSPVSFARLYEIL